VLGALAMATTVGLYTQASWATSFWPWPDARMSFVFLAGVAAAFAVPTIWTGLVGEPAALAGMALSAIVVNGLAVVYFAAIGMRDGDGDQIPAVGLCLMTVGAGTVVYRWSDRQPVRDPRPTPRFVLRSFVAFVAILTGVGIALIVQVEHVLPWDLSPGTSTLFGFIFLGAAAYFGDGLARRRWALAAGQLWGFLAYDLVLAIPYVKMLGQPAAATGGDAYGFYDYGYGYGLGPATTAAGNGINELSLAVYLSILAFSAGLTLFCALAHPETRLIARKARG
jgi:hypothetical protein